MPARAPIVVVGSGIAGLCTALAAAPRPVVLLSRKARGTDSASVLAQGGIAAAIGAGDSIESHVADTLAAGCGLNDVSRVRMLAAAAPAAIEWLQAQGVAFDHAEGTLILGREGGHRFARIVHAGGDASGARISAALSTAVAAAAHVEWRSDVDVDALLMQGNRVSGVRINAGGHAELIASPAVVLATGGIGALFARTTNPEAAEGSGLALAIAAGAEVRDLEFVQFHPTALDLDSHSLPLLTEALRGAGARLLDPDGKPIMEGLHALADLAPRDVVARRVWQVRKAQGAVMLDARNLDIDWPQAFPTVLATCLRHGIDPRRMAIPVTAAAHFHMGGIRTDGDGRSSLEGLYAVGEVACNGLHGANRLASNSLLECVVAGRLLGAQLGAGMDSEAIESKTQAMAIGSGLDAAELSLLRDTLWRTAGPLRCGADLAGGLRTLQPLLARGWQARLACQLLLAASKRAHSIGAHWREDAEDAGSNAASIAA